MVIDILKASLSFSVEVALHKSQRCFKYLWSERSVFQNELELNQAIV